MINVVFKLAGNPRGKQRPKFSGRGGFVRTYTPKETVDYEKAIANAYKAAGGGLIENAVCMTVVAYMPIPKSTTKKEKELIANGRVQPRKKPDIDNIIKVVMDGLNGIAYEDDKQVIAVTGVKRYALHCEPHISVKLTDNLLDAYDLSTYF